MKKLLIRFFLLVSALLLIVSCNNNVEQPATKEATKEVSEIGMKNNAGADTFIKIPSNIIDNLMEVSIKTYSWETVYERKSGSSGIVGKWSQTGVLYPNGVEITFNKNGTYHYSWIIDRTGDYEVYEKNGQYYIKLFWEEKNREKIKKEYNLVYLCSDNYMCIQKSDLPF